MPPPERTSILCNWRFVASKPDWRLRRERLKAFLGGVRRAPAYKTLRAITPHPRWVGYFIYAPAGRLTEAHLFTLAALQARAYRILVVVACADPASLPRELHEFSDALYWKDLPGYDFSAYALMLRALAKRSENADVLLFNDSVFGPFRDLEPLFAAAPWRLTGLTSSSFIENHIQSYAFLFKRVNASLIAHLGSVFPRRLCISEAQQVILLQELRLARVASRHMTAGSLWHTDDPSVTDLPIHRPFALIERGFPFLKRSLFEKFQHLHDGQALARLLAANRHPIP